MECSELKSAEGAEVAVAKGQHMEHKGLVVAVVYGLLLLE